MKKTNGTFQEYCEWVRKTGCASCVYNKRLFSIWEYLDKTKIHDFKFECRFYKKMITSKDCEPGRGCKANLE